MTERGKDRRQAEAPIIPPDVARDALKDRRIFGTGISKGTGLITTGVILKSWGEMVGVVRDPEKISKRRGA